MLAITLVVPERTLHPISCLQLAGRTVNEVDERLSDATQQPAGASGIASVPIAVRGPARGRRLDTNEPPYLGAPAREVDAPGELHLEVVELLL